MKLNASVSAIAPSCFNQSARYSLPRVPLHHRVAIVLPSTSPSLKSLNLLPLRLEFATHFFI